MMRCKGKEVMEESNFLAKVCRKQAPIVGKEIQKMLQWFQMGLKEQESLARANLEGLFTVHWTIPWGDLLGDFFCTWEFTKDGKIRALVCGEKIVID